MWYCTAVSYENNRYVCYSIGNALVIFERGSCAGRTLLPTLRCYLLHDITAMFAIEARSDPDMRAKCLAFSFNYEYNKTRRGIPALRVSFEGSQVAPPKLSNSSKMPHFLIYTGTRFEMFRRLLRIADLFVCEKTHLRSSNQHVIYAEFDQVQILSSIYYQAVSDTSTSYECTGTR